MTLTAPIGDFGTTVSDALDEANPSNLPDAIREVSLGTLIGGLIPRWRTFAGLTSAAAQVLNSELDGSGDSQAAIVLAVCDAANAPLDIVQTGVGAGEVEIAYSSEGVPTLTFNAAVTGFQALICPLPSGLATALATRI